MKRLSLVLVIGIVAACTSSGDNPRSEHRYENAEQGYSVDQPNGWTPSLVRGSAQFAPSEGAKTDKNNKHTILVRAADMPRELKEGKPTTADDVIAATEKVLRGMPKAKLGERVKLDNAELPGARFSMTFTPRGLTPTYRREHVVLVGTKHVFHVIYTAPKSEAVDEAAFKNMVSTLSEEG